MMPEDAYLAAVGRAVYTVAYVEWLAIEVVTRLDQRRTLEELASRGTGAIAKALHRSGRRAATTQLQREIEECAVEFDRIADRRNDVVHARPATAADGSQRLVRWAPRARRAASGFIDEDRLERLVTDALELNRRLNTIRNELP